jgi:hypothetical protein
VQFVLATLTLYPSGQCTILGVVRWDVTVSRSLFEGLELIEFLLPS